MKKALSLFMTFTILILTVLCAPLSAQAAEYTPDKKIYAKAYMLVNLDDDSYPVVTQKNADEKMYPASLTKIVTAMVVLNNVTDLSQKATMSQSAYDALINTGAQVAGIQVGESLTIEELLYLTMVHSACDACQVLAEFVGGDTNTFVQMMNDWVKSIGCQGTHFVNPDGLHDPNHYTTVNDMKIITLEAMKNDMFNKISTTKSYNYKNMTLIHTNYMLDRAHLTYYYEYAEGIKTGSTGEAGYCVITKASKNGYNYLAIVMGSPIKNLNGIDTKCSFIDAASLFDWAFDSLKYTTVIRQNDVVSEVPGINGKDADTVQLVAQADVTSLVPSTLDPSAVIVEPVNPPTEIEAPVTKGDKICKANIIYADQTVATVQLVAAQTVELSTFLKILNALKKFFSNKFVLLVIFVIILALIAYVIIFIARLQKDKKRIAEKRRKQEELDNQINSNDDFLPPPRR